jgi:hypothetical protein
MSCLKLALSLLLLSLGSLPVFAHAAGCSNASIKGTYGDQSTVTQTNDVPPFFGELVGTLRFDGAGAGVYNFVFARSDGSVGPASEDFTYAVSPDCTLTIAWANSETFAGVLVLDGKEIVYVETSGACCGSAIIRRGRATRLHTGN